MSPIHELLAGLSARLPELEWKISELTVPITSHNLPKGLFHPTHELTASTCIAEIKADIHHLSHQENKRGAEYIATRIKQKINVLVALCQIDRRRKKPEQKTVFTLDMLSTRQQWISTLEKNINTLTLQYQALTRTVQHMKTDTAAEVILCLKSELGEVERRLTLAQEALNQAIF